MLSPKLACEENKQHGNWSIDTLNIFKYTFEVVDEGQAEAPLYKCFERKQVGNRLPWKTLSKKANVAFHDEGLDWNASKCKDPAKGPASIESSSWDEYE